MKNDIMEKARELAQKFSNVYCKTVVPYMLSQSENTANRVECPYEVTQPLVELIAAALSEARTVPQWLPIESAPANGTECLIASFIVTSDVAQNNGAKPFWDIAIGSCYSRTIKEGRWSSILGSNPTHWMPLPAAPQSANRRG